MAGSRNSASLLGFLTTDPIIQPYKGTPAAFLQMFTVERWADKQGNAKEKVEQHNVIVLNDRHVKSAQHLREGNQVLIKGQLEGRKVEGKDGQPDQYFSEIVLRRYKGELAGWEGSVNTELKVPNSSNHILVMGNLGQDPEIRKLANGSEVAHLRLATSTYLGANVTPKTEWHRVVVFNERLIRVVEKLVKGNHVCIEGQIQTRPWTDNDGHPRKTTEIVMSNFGGEVTLTGQTDNSAGNSGGYKDDSPGSAARRRNNASTASGETTTGQKWQPDGSNYELDDEIPF